MNHLSRDHAEEPIRPSLKALAAAAAPPSLADSLDELEEVLVSFAADLDKLSERMTPMLHPDESDEVTPAPHLAEGYIDAAPAVCRVVDARRHLAAMHDQLFDLASRLAL